MADGGSLWMSSELSLRNRKVVFKYNNKAVEAKGAGGVDQETLLHIGRLNFCACWSTGI